MSIMPICRLGSNNYLLGTESRKINVQKGQLQVKTEQGFTSLIEYLDNAAQIECLKLRRIIEDEDITLAEAILQLL